MKHEEHLTFVASFDELSMDHCVVALSFDGFVNVNTMMTFCAGRMNSKKRYGPRFVDKTHQIRRVEFAS